MFNSLSDENFSVTSKPVVQLRDKKVIDCLNLTNQGCGDKLSFWSISFSSVVTVILTIFYSTNQSQYVKYNKTKQDELRTV
jgi:hypothetical protein